MNSATEGLAVSLPAAPFSLLSKGPLGWLSSHLGLNWILNTLFCSWPLWLDFQNHSLSTVSLPRLLDLHRVNLHVFAEQLAQNVLVRVATVAVIFYSFPNSVASPPLWTLSLTLFGDVQTEGWSWTNGMSMQTWKYGCQYENDLGFGWNCIKDGD